MQQIQIQTATQDKAAYNRNAQKIIDKLIANDLEFIDATLEYAQQVFNSNEPPLRKLLILRLIKDAIVIKSAKKFINKYIQTRPLLTFIGNICTHKLGDSNPNRGADLFQGQDPQSSIEFLNLALELIEFLATTFPKDYKQAPTKFKIQYDELVQMGVKFPPLSSLILPFDPNHASQNPIQKPFDNNKERDETMLKLNQSKKNIYQDIEMINETLVNNSDMAYINEVLVTYCEQMNVMELSFDNLIKKAQQYQGVLNEDELAELYALKDFIQKFQIYYYGYLEEECTSGAYNSLKKKTLAHIQKIQNKDFEFPPPQQQKQQKSQHFQYTSQFNFIEYFKVQQQSQFQNEDEMFRRAIEESKIQQQNSIIQQKQQEEKKKQEEIKRQQDEELRQAKLREEQMKYEYQRLEEQRKEHDRKEQIRYEQNKQKKGINKIRIKQIGNLIIIIIIEKIKRN